MLIFGIAEKIAMLDVGIFLGGSYRGLDAGMPS